jgi:homoserine kinase
MGERSVQVQAPASSANLGPGFDVLAAALDLRLTLTVTEAEEFSVDAGGVADIATDRSELCVTAFESLDSSLTADGFRFEISVGMPTARGFGASAAAIVAGLLAADQICGAGLTPQDLYEKAAKIECHPDNVAAAVYGGFVICPRGPDGRPRGAPVTLAVPPELAAVLLIPDEALRTTDAREALPDEAPLTDAVHNIAAACQLVLGLERGDPALVARGLSDRLHQPHRASLYGPSYEVVSRAGQFGEIGATISGAGPSVLLWCLADHAHSVAQAAQVESGGWATLREVPFTARGAEVISSFG